MSIYAEKIREQLKGAVDTRLLAEAWAALHPKDFAKALDPALSAFLARAADAIARALKAVLPGALTEGWTLGQLSAEALAGLEAVDWAGWEPGDPDAAAIIAGDGLEQLLNSMDVQIKSIAQSRLSELGDVLAEYMSSPVAIRPDLPEPLPPQFSVDALARALEGVLDNPSRAEMVAQSEIARAQGAAAEWVFRRMSVQLEEISTAGDRRVCPKCAAAEAAGPRPVGTYQLGLHPMCRCAKIPVIAGANLSGSLAGVS